mmetsp:Transcript_17356/g.31286  ORF Transcript_17356/g.31286 Transcript_17356/m.31286 type:complete len:406 (+) Transcript_17356:9573-10790(+)
MEASNPILNWFENQPKNCSAKSAAKIQSFFNAFNLQGETHLRLVQSLAFTGIPDEPRGLRALIWKILLNYLPPDATLWMETLSKQREVYEFFKREFLKNPSLAGIDHPLSMDRQSSWNTYHSDQLLRDEIDKDVKRTRPEMHFFFMPSDSSLTLEKVESGELPPRPYARPYLSILVENYGHSEQENPFFTAVMENENVEKHADVLSRILFIYAKLNPGVQYVQGMNEILAPIYHLFARDPHPEFVHHAEADSFFCFVGLMAEVRDNFVKTMDQSSSGINSQFAKLNDMLSRHDREVWQILEDLGITTQFYAMRWLMLLMTQEFDMPDVMRLWDSLLADSQRFSFLYYFCIAIIESVRDSVLKKDFSIALSALQHPPLDDLVELLSLASVLSESDQKSTRRRKDSI